ncbi:MAG: YggS family pyridoxal phosphate-dependent enzyme [Flavobacteriales bacterium]|nr:YggS family pyridoxal phosphate-dependent enzyme [Flavobacteriales bacterium]|tara:strand:+ start:31638 stop:32279 length:642 start_codon:yes stop_codon:yes gene_type:complete
MGVIENLHLIKQTIPQSVCLIAVSKTQSNYDILKAYNAGQKNFGENKVQELVQKQEKLPKDIRWHMIGHLQTNKVKFIAPFIDMIHSVDSLKLINEIDKRAKQNNRIIDCLLQVHIANEKTKFGFEPDKIEGVIEETKKNKNINIKGLMGMASFTDNKNEIIKEFSLINTLFKKVENEKINVLSTGMSSDYLIAIENGSNMIRLGSIIFGKRI